MTDPENPSPPPLSPTSLDPQERSTSPFDEEGFIDGHPLDTQSRCQDIAHRHHQGTRRRIIDALHGDQDPKQRKRANRLGCCCQCPVWYERSDGELAPALRRCRDRMCPFCARKRGAQAAVKCHRLIQLFDAPRMVTLTQLSKAESLPEAIARIVASFKALQKLPFWRSRVRGGVWALEITRNAISRQWHAHIHVIVDSDFLPQPLLKAKWLEVTGDSFIVDVRAVHDRREAAKYVAQYVAKPLDVQRWPAEAIREFALALHGKRMLQPFGVAFKADLDDDDEAEPPPEYTEICPALSLIEAFNRGSEAARHAREILARMGTDAQIAVGLPRDFDKPVPAAVEPWERDYATRVLKLVALIGPALPHAIDARAGLPGQPMPAAPPTPFGDDRLFETQRHPG